jgi:Fe-S-cluster containining protein
VDPDVRARVVARLEKAWGKRQVSRQTKVGAVPCPLLENNRCLVYPVRPLTCQGFNSSDARLCRASVETSKQIAVPIYPPQLRLMTLVLDGMCAGLKESKLEGKVLDLAVALHIALTVPETINRCLNGEPVFALAQLLES